MELRQTHTQDEKGVAALHAAAFAPDSDTRVIEMLLDANARVVQAAAISGKARAVLILHNRGASPDHA